MKWLKVCALVIVTLAAMRAAGWVVAWALSRVGVSRVRLVAVIANLVAFAAFLLLLYASLLPGEPLDMAAVVFGLVVFVIYTLTDFRWTPWKGRH
jgi:hypothetical protein